MGTDRGGVTPKDSDKTSDADEATVIVHPQSKACLEIVNAPGNKTDLNNIP